jgi:hypothetical protein
MDEPVSCAHSFLQLALILLQYSQEEESAMQTKKIICYLALFCLLLTPLACNLPGSARTLTPAPINQTLTAVMSNLTVTAILQSVVTATSQPPTAVSSATAQPPTIVPTDLPCNWAEFVMDVTVPDGTQVLTGSAFAKTWRLRNIGSCTWSNAYQLIFAGGNAMGALTAVNLNGTVPPGATVDISIALTAPAAPGSYTGSFRLRAGNGAVFGIGADGASPFWVKINALAPTASPTPTSTPVLLPDLTITEFTLSPASPVAGTPVHVRIGVYNNGNAAAGAYTVKWWGLDTFADPSCTWNVPGSNAKGGRILECDYTFSNWYGAGVFTKAAVDTEFTVVESDEGNNVFKAPITVNKP